MTAMTSPSPPVGTPAVPTDLHTGGLGGHPRGLTTLFLAEMWERFSFYGMRAILMLFMVLAVTEGGLGYDTKKAAGIYGTYTMSGTCSASSADFMADNFIGARRSVLIGGIIIALGHFTMALNSELTFFIGLALVAAGTGLLKPNISTMVGSLYRPEDERRDAGFSIFYMGINLGAFLAPLICGYLAQSASWKATPRIGWGLATRAAAGTGASPPPASA
jgi:POT family proton-dependent oligopeptide transporter